METVIPKHIQCCMSNQYISKYLSLWILFYSNKCVFETPQLILLNNIQFFMTHFKHVAKQQQSHSTSFCNEESKLNLMWSSVKYRIQNETYTLDSGNKHDISVLPSFSIAMMISIAISSLTCSPQELIY